MLRTASGTLRRALWGLGAGACFALPSTVPVAVLLFLSPPALAGDNAGKGAKVFKTCGACHSLEPAVKKLGPSLHGVLNRPAGSVPGFRYSKAMQKAGEDGLIWNEKTLDEYLSAPKKFVPGNRMPFPGLKDAEKRVDVIAYIKEAATNNVNDRR